MTSSGDNSRSFAAQDAENRPEEVTNQSTREIQEQGECSDKRVAWLTHCEPEETSPRRRGIKWGGLAARYEWKDEYGDVGPRNDELEQELFKNSNVPRPGNHANELQLSDDNAAYFVSVEGDIELNPITKFDGAGLHPVMMENIAHCGYEWPTAIQAYCIPALHEKLDVIAVAQTGSGKTAAFLIPIISQLMGKAKQIAAPRPNAGDPKGKGTARAEPLVVIICPTRELANQTFDEARRLCYRSMLRPCVAYGGAPKQLQQNELQKGCDVLVGTPGRILDFLNRPGVLAFNRVRYAVIDEADELLQPVWEKSFHALIAELGSGFGEPPRFLMFSATFNQKCQQLARQYLSPKCVRLEITRPGTAVRHIRQEVSPAYPGYYELHEKKPLIDPRAPHTQIMWVNDGLKLQALVELIFSLPKARTLIFANTKLDVDQIDDYLYNHGLPSTSIHADRTQREREDALRAFRSAHSPILVTTGLSARGLDVVNVLHVINFSLPRARCGGITEYIHRIGRTARIGNQGVATSFFNNADRALAPALTRLLNGCDQKVPDFLEQYLGSSWHDENNIKNPAADEGHYTQSGWNNEAGTASNNSWGPASDAGDNNDPWKLAADASKNDSGSSRDNEHGHSDNEASWSRDDDEVGYSDKEAGWSKDDVD
ncbi:ATP-dependent RNA helicase ded1, partial [Penicillium diatomitis]